MTKSLDEMLAVAQRPALHLRKTPEANGFGAPGCWLGGEPTLPAGFNWPTYEAPGVPTVPLHFLAQIALEEVIGSPDLPHMPNQGTLFFFFDTIFAPTLGMEPHGARVIYVEHDVTGCPARKMPPIPDVSDHFDDSVSFWFRDAPTAGFQRWPFTFEPVTFTDEVAFPEEDFWRAAVNALLAEQAGLEKLTRKDRARGVLPGSSAQFAMHRMFGANSPDISVSGDDWVTLLTVETDDDLGFTYGDAQPVSFMIRKGDLAEGNFDNVRFC